MTVMIVSRGQHNQDYVSIFLSRLGLSLKRYMDKGGSVKDINFIFLDVGSCDLTKEIVDIVSGSFNITYIRIPEESFNIENIGMLFANDDKIVVVPVNAYMYEDFIEVLDTKSTHGIMSLWDLVTCTKNENTHDEYSKNIVQQLLSIKNVEKTLSSIVQLVKPQLFWHEIIIVQNESQLLPNICDDDEHNKALDEFPYWGPIGISLCLEKENPCMAHIPCQKKALSQVREFVKSCEEIIMTKNSNKIYPWEISNV